jgi:two-component system nitrate/nitrite sensor histidine kinase NarX
MTGASAAVVRGIGADGAIGTPVAAVGRPVSRRAPWCAVCDEDLGPDSDCVARHVLGVADEVVASAVTQVCHHVATIPLEHRDRPVGTLGLFFASPCRIAPEITPVLEAVGALLGVTLENGRLAAENLRMSLVSERQMMANEVHDSLAQALTYMRMRMSLLADAIRERDELRAFKYWSDVDDSLTHAHRRLRELITCFRSRMDPQGLVHALSETAAGFFDRTGVDLVFRNDVPDFCLPAEREVEVFHIVQEALANACRHAQARRVELSLDRGEAGSGYEITIVDDGVGLASGADGDADDAGHYGLSIMRERARRLGGSLALESAAGRGTRVRLSIPAAATASGKGT